MNLNTSSQFTERDALDHVWSWFTLHAGQRIQVINFHLAFTGLFVVAYATSLNAHRYGQASGLAIFLAIASLALFGLELRNKELVKASEDALKVLEDEMSESLRIPELRLVLRVETTKSRLGSHGRILRALYTFTIVFACAGAIAAGLL